MYFGCFYYTDWRRKNVPTKIQSVQVSSIKFWLLCWFCWFFMYIYFCAIFLCVYFKNWHFWCRYSNFLTKFFQICDALEKILITLFKSDSEMYFLKLSNDPQISKQNNSVELKIVQKFKNYGVPSPPPSPKKSQLLITRFARLLLAALCSHWLRTT